MPIKFRCPHASCGKPLTVSDGAAGRSGNCPGCGGALVVPRPEPASDDLPFDLELLPEPEPVPVPRSKPTSAPVSSWPADDPDWAPVVGSGAGGPVVSFDALGLAWKLLNRQMGTWILAVLVVGLVQFGCQIVLTIVSGLAAVVEANVIRSPVPISSLAVMVVGMMIQCVLIGGLYRMALKQIDGGEIGVGDVFQVGGVAPGLILAGLLTTLGTYLGLFFLVIPGLVFAGLAMFAEPAVVDGVGAVEAIKRSVGTLSRQWFSATVFLFVMGMILAAGAMLFGVGMLFTLPLFVLAVTVQYRRSFAPGGVPRKAVVADPWAEAVGEPAGVIGSRGVPVWAWGLLGVGFLVPVALICVVAALVIPAARKAAQVAVDRDRMINARVDAKGQGGFPGGFPAPGALAPPNAPAPPVDLVKRAVDDARKPGNERLSGISMLYSLNADDRHRAAVMAALTPLLDDSEAGGDAARAMEVWAGPDDLPTLINGLGSDQVRVRMFLFRALRRLKAQAAIPVLVEHMARPEDRGEASRALEAIGKKAAPEIQKLLTNDDRETRREAGKLLKQIIGNDREMQRSLALATLKSTDSWECDRALEDLARLPVVETSRDEVLAAALPLLKAPESSNRGNALKVVETWGTAEQVPALIEVLDDRDRNIRVKAIAALRKFPDPRSALAMARLLTTQALRREATDALVALKPRDAEVEAEVVRALDSPDWPVRQAACQVLRAIGTSSSVPALKKAASDDNRTVANAALAALTAIDPSAKPDAPSGMPKSKMPTRKKR